MNVTPVALILFDLDGTLADTAPDMGASLNRLRAEHGLPPLSMHEIRPQVSHGASALLQLGFSKLYKAETQAQLRSRFLELYRQQLCVQTRLFDGMDSVLVTLEQRAIPWGIVTNKPGNLTQPLLDALALTSRSACVVSGDTLERRKPHPDPLLHACNLCGVSPVDTLYIGDSERDVQAGKAAGMLTAVARYGYIGETESPLEWGADYEFLSPSDLFAWIMNQQHVNVGRMV